MNLHTPGQTYQTAANEAYMTIFDNGGNERAAQRRCSYYSEELADFVYLQDFIWLQQISCVGIRWCIEKAGWTEVLRDDLGDRTMVV